MFIVYSFLFLNIFPIIIHGLSDVFNAPLFITYAWGGGGGGGVETSLLSL